MKRPHQHQLEYESRLALRNSLPSAWIVRDKDPDYGIDMEIEIVEGEDVTNKILWIQIKAKNKIKTSSEKISYQMKTKHLKYYEHCHFPVLIFYWIKSENTFYYLFAQRYIKEEFSKINPNWRSQKSISVEFPPVSKLDNIQALKSIATEGYLYIIQNELNIQPESKSAYYWLNGIPKSDNEELKERTLKALLYMQKGKYINAIGEFCNILRECAISPIEKMPILLNLGNAYYIMGQIEDAYKNYDSILKLCKRVNKKNYLEGKAAAFSGLGLVYCSQGDLDNAFNYYNKAISINQMIGNNRGLADNLGNISLIYLSKGDLDNAIECMNNATKIHKDIGCKNGEADDLGNIGVIYKAKGDLDKAELFFNSALKIHKEIGYKLGEAADLGNIGLIFKARGILNKAFNHYIHSLKIYREIGYKQGEADQLCNIGLVYKAKGDLDKAMLHLTLALKILIELNLMYGRNIIVNAINLIIKEKQQNNKEKK